jgi:predicted amidohydrolase
MKIATQTISDRNLVNNPSFDGANAPDGWSFITPRPDLALGHEWKRERSQRSLVLSATSDRDAIACWRGTTSMQRGKWYKASVKVRMTDIANPPLSIIAHAGKHFLSPSGPWQQETLLEQVFKLDSEYEGSNFELYLRAAQRGQVEWLDPCVVEIAEPKFRMARVATVRFDEPQPKLSLEEIRKRIEIKLNEVGGLKPDIVALTEFCAYDGFDHTQLKYYADAAEFVPDGPTSKLISAMAKKYRMYIMVGIVERRGKHVFNTAVIFDRQGNIAGKYDKTHPTFREIVDGISAGSSYPVFDLDFGRVAVHICYDEWFPEVARYFAHLGAEILFLPTWGGKPISWRTRALDNNIYIVSSSASDRICPPSMIIDSSGAIIAEVHRDGVACADLNLDLRQTNAYIDPTLAYGMPYTIPQLRYTADDRLLADLFKLMRERGSSHE